MYIGMSSGGIFESTDRGADWKPLNHGVRADFLPDPNAEFGHDPHCLRLHPLLPDRLYHQNHTGIYRLDRPADRWTDIGASMPKSVGSIGFPMVLHPRDPDTLWVFPMDGTSVWPRVSPGGKPAAYRSVNGGKTWQRQATGLPKSQAWWTVKRQAMTADAARDGGRLLRHDERRGVGKPRRRPHVEMPRPATCRTSTPSRSPEVARYMQVRIPGLLRSYTQGAETVALDRTAPSPTLADALAETRRAAFRGSDFGSSTSRERSGRTSRSSSTASSRAILKTVARTRGRADDRRRAFGRLTRRSSLAGAPLRRSISLRCVGVEPL